jgi:ribosomal protein S12 methylthiotransferase accessory factor
MLIAQSGTTDVRIGGKEINRDIISSLVRDCHMLVGCFDKGFSSSNHWLNRASLEHGIPAVYAESRAHTALVGPMVLPGQTACYMCYRMRSIACAADFTEAMEYEEFLDKRKRPMLHERAVLPTIPPYIASVLTQEILKQLLSISESSLAGNVLEFNALTLESDRHSILQKPDCPVCNPQKKRDRQQPPLNEFKQASTPAGDLLVLEPKLVSHRTGVVQHLHPVQKDISEPIQPYVFRAELANHLFVEDAKRDARVCSGKGFTAVAAKISALGEAVERYSGACWDYEDIVYARRSELVTESLDPRQLVLYAEEQYIHLPYAPYDDENVMGWIQARSLITNRQVYVPAIAVYMQYQVRTPVEYIFPITSNGLATGATLLNAVLSAALEVIERDAFMITWLHQLPAHRITWENHPDQEVRHLCLMYRRRGVEMHLYQLPTDHPCHVFAAVAVQVRDVEPKVVVGMGADLRAHRAARKAIIEVGQVRPSLRQRCRLPEHRQRMDELVADPHRVKDLDDHDLLYASPRAVQPLEFLLHQDPVVFTWDSEVTRSTSEDMQQLVDDFTSKGQDLLYYNLTPPDMRELGLYTVRVIIPGFQPIDFGWQERRLGGERLYELPQRLGFATNRAQRELLNDAPHPIA